MLPREYFYNRRNGTQHGYFNIIKARHRTVTKTEYLTLAKYGHRRIIGYLLETSPYTDELYFQIRTYAYLYGYLDIASKLFPPAPTGIVDSLTYGYLDLVKYSLPLTSMEINSLLIRSVKNNQPYLVRYFLRQGARLIDESIAGITFASLKLLQRYNIEISERQMEQLCYSRDVKIVRLNLQPRMDLDPILYNACQHGLLDIVQLLVYYGVKDLNSGCYFATVNGYSKIVEFLFESGAKPGYRFYEAYRRIKSEGRYPEICQLYEEKLSKQFWGSWVRYWYDY